MVADKVEKSRMCHHHWLLISAIALVTPFTCAQDARLIRVAGTPEEIGTIWGTVNKDVIVHDVNDDFLKRAVAAGISRETLVERSATFVRIAEKTAPHLLKEIRAIARAAGVDEVLYIAFADGQSRNRYLHADAPDEAIVECTSYAVSRDHARDGAILFHKTRDNADSPQTAAVIASSLEGINKFIAVTNSSAIRCSMMVNEKGLAGSADYPADKKTESSTLYLEPAEPRYRGMMAGMILRHIAETASSSGEALAIIEEFVKKGYYAGGDVNGSHWLFVDRQGTILEVCNNAQHVVSTVHTQKAYFSRFNKCEPAQHLRDADGVDFGMFHNIAREKPLLTPESISGMTVEIDPDQPEWFTCAWISLPVHAVSFPVFMGQEGTPTPLFDGRVYALGKKSPLQAERWANLEDSMHVDKERLKEDVAASLAEGKSVQTQIERLEQWSAEQAKRLIAALENGNS